MQRPLHSISAGLLLILTSLAIFESNTYAADKWLAVRSKDFLLVGNASESAIRRVGRNLEEFRAGFGLLFPAIVQQAPPPITVVVFKDDSSFRPFKPLYQGKPANIAGYFQPGQDMNFIALTTDTETPHVIYHEFVHSLTEDSVNLPPWASEGLAEFWGMFEIDPNGKEMLLGRPMDDHIETLHKGFLPLQKLFSVEHNSPEYNEETKQGIFYAESWALIDYLMLGNKGQRRPQLPKFLASVSSGKSIQDSFRDAFQTDYSALEGEVKNYISRFTFPALKFKLQDKIDFDRDMQVSMLSDAQAQYYLGDLLLHMNRLDAADTQLQKALSLDSHFAPTYASLGMLYLRQDRQKDALKFLAQAVQTDSSNYMAHYYYASLLQSESDDTADGRTSRFRLMRDHLKKTIELSPAYIYAYDMLGYVALSLHEELPETEELLKKVFNAAPARKNIRIRLAELMIANNEPIPARVILKAMPVGGDDDHLQKQARELIDQVQRQLDNEQALRDYEQRRREAEAREAAAAARIEASTSKADPIDERPTIRRNNETPATDDAPIATAKVQLRRPAGPEIQGSLLSVDCTRGLTLRVRVGNGNVELHADDPSKIEFISYTSAIKDSFECGLFKSQPPVRIVYRQTGDGRYLGEPLSVEFIEKK